MENSNQKSSRTLNVILWIAQLLLAAMFLMAGFMKVATPVDQLAATLPWAVQIPEALVKIIGVSEVLGALGLLLPSALRIMPQLTVLASRALIVLMILALAFHLFRGEFSATVTNVVLGSIAFFVAWGRSKKAVIHARAQQPSTQQV
jgi:putative oxidoreductase